MNSYTLNNMIQLTGVFTVVGTGAAATPTTVVCRITDPNGAVTDISGSVSNPTAGTYTAIYTPTAITGVYQYEFIGSGAVVSAGVQKFLVNQATF